MALMIFGRSGVCITRLGEPGRDRSQTWANPEQEDRWSVGAVPFMQRAGCLNLERLEGICLWKAARVVWHATGEERRRIRRRSWFHRERHPIFDFRALWSLDAEVPDWYSFEFWWEYVQTCRALADEHGVDMRTLDRALWQFSKERQQG